tara:strand:- start:80894 stop:81904 length:1011 start_codon:yes stop_codon:yes gene_type:complete
MNFFGDPTVWLPFTFAALMGLSILIYVVLDGFDLGIGVLFPFVGDDDKDQMISAIGPFWDANETWLVLAIGLLLVAFPSAHGYILTALYLPVAIMLAGLILRGVAFELRAKAPAGQKEQWNRSFFVGSLLTSLSQGFMLGMYIVGLDYTWPHVAFACLTALCLTAGYGFIGATWMIYKTEHDLQRRAVRFATFGLLGVVIGFVAISLASPLVSPRIFAKWFTVPEVFYLAPLPILSGVLVVMIGVVLRRMPHPADHYAWLPFVAAASLFCLAFAGLAYSFYPYVVPDKISIYEAASAPESLFIILLGALVVMPAIVAYTVLSYVVFRGKARALTYD